MFVSVDHCAHACTDACLCMTLLSCSLRVNLLICNVGYNLRWGAVSGHLGNVKKFISDRLVPHLPSQGCFRLRMKYMGWKQNTPHFPDNPACFPFCLSHIVCTNSSQRIFLMPTGSLSPLSHVETSHQNHTSGCLNCLGEGGVFSACQCKQFQKNLWIICAPGCSCGCVCLHGQVFCFLLWCGVCFELYPACCFIPVRPMMSSCATSEHIHV